MPDKLTFDVLRDAVAGTGCAFRSRVVLQPAAGEGTKVFPPTYAGAVYATERQRLPGYKDPVECVLLDSVQSQANRMEEALQQASDTGRIRLPITEVDFGKYSPDTEQSVSTRLLDPVGRVTSLQVPHRIADAIIRDSLLGETPFRETEIGKRIGMASARDATALFEYCPTALLFGMWDSTGPKGGLGSKFERAIVGEVVGIDAVYGIRTASRVDPVIRKNPPLYETVTGDWTVLESEAARSGAGNEPKKYRKKLSELNLGNVTPSFGKYTKGAEGRDPLFGSSIFLNYNDQRADDSITLSVGMNRRDNDAREGRIAPGGVTVARAELTVVLSLPALRRIAFPVKGIQDRTRDNAARTVLAALGLCAATLSAENGFDLRSRCLLWPTEPLNWELLGTSGTSTEVTLSSEEATTLLQQAVKAAKDASLPWREDPLQLLPSPKLVQTVVRSQQLAVQQGGETGEGGDS